VAVARHGAALPLPAVAWRSEAGPLTVLAGLSLALLVLGPRALRRRRVGLLVAVTLAAVVLVRVPMSRVLPSAWPPSGWVAVACDVGQGDGLVLRAGEGAAVVVDTGPDPAAMDGCLDRLGIRSVPLVVLSHFHADHISGLEGVLRGRRVDELEVTGLAEPADNAAAVAAIAATTGLAPRVPDLGETRRVGDVVLQVVSLGAGTTDPEPVTPPDEAPGEGSAANNASIVMVAEVRGIRILLTGYIEPEAQARIAATVPGLRVDVLKVPHHGSSHQDFDWLRSLGARVALISVGADNDYGHPSPDVVDALTAAGTLVLRTDLQGDLAVTVTDGGSLATATAR
jgi:competence protein ComEC